MKLSKGFTLLEVMIAITIMAVAFGAILTSQNGTIRTTMRTKEMNIAGWLAHNLMVESEHLYEGKSFTELPKEEIKTFDAPYSHYQWKREVKEIKFPEISFPAKEGEGLPEPVRVLAKTTTKFLNDSIRELIITVSWDRGKGRQEIVLTTYLIDLNKEFNFAL